MDLKFTKMQSCGNDYIYINCFESEISSPELLSPLLSDRHHGIGGDGIILMLPSRKADAEMRIFNQDGSEAEMCGNGIRCVAKYLYDNGIVRKPEMKIDTPSGVKSLYLTIQNSIVSSVKVDMGKAELSPGKIPAAIPGDSIINRQINIEGTAYYVTCVSMGNPHAVIFCDDIKELPIEIAGCRIENNPLFPERINVEFVEVVDKSTLRMRVWERGSGETMACGTGACASVVAAVLNGYCDRSADIKVALLGGELTISYISDTVYMTGDCHKVFDGMITI